MKFHVWSLFQGIEELTPVIKRWVFLATTVTDIAVPILNYGLIVIGASILIYIFVRAYKNVVFTREALEKGKETLRRGSSFIVNGQHRLLIVRDSYTLLNNMSTDPDPDAEPEVWQAHDSHRRQIVDLKSQRGSSITNNSFVPVERTSWICSVMNN